MLGIYVPILVMMIVATVIAVGMVVASFLLGPKKPTRYKETPYECGITPVGSARERFPVKFYLVAMLFIIFDIETVFLYPWAVIFRGPEMDRVSKLFLVAEMGFFVAILFVGYFYILGKGALEWDEGQREEEEKRDRRIYAPRPPILFGNETREPIRLAAKTAASARQNGNREEAPRMAAGSR